MRFARRLRTSGWCFMHGRNEFERLLAEGQEKEREFQQIAVGYGYHVIPMGDMNTDGAPTFLTQSGAVVSPDVILIHPRNATRETRVIGIEVKSKTSPSFRFKGRYRGWWHGCDLRLFEGDYRVAYEGWDSVCFVVREDWTLPYPGYVPPMPAGDNYDSASLVGLVPGPVWRSISYAKALEMGRVSEKHFNGKDAWVWPLEAMTLMEIPQC